MLRDARRRRGHVLSIAQSAAASLHVRVGDRLRRTDIPSTLSVVG